MESIRFAAFDTLVEIAVDSGDAPVLEACRAECERYERLFSRFEEQGSLWRLNHAGGCRMQVPEELASFISQALGYCARSEGRFDITMGSVCRLWDFHEGRLPQADELACALHHVDWHGVHVEGNEVWLDDPDAWIDLGGIAKGYIADSLGDLLRAHGVDSAIVDLGGNILTLGSKAGDRPWRIGIRSPRPSVEDPRPFAVVEVRNKSVVTSGVYERAFEKDGVVYHHVLDPASGYPVETDLVSATVVSERSVDGDGYSTTLLSLGSARALAFAQGLPAVEAVFLTREGAVLKTDGIQLELL